MSVWWNENATGHRQSRRLLECTNDNVLLQFIQEPTRRGATLELVFTNKEGLEGKSRSAWVAVGMKILSAMRSVHRNFTALDFRDLPWDKAKRDPKR